MHINNVVVEGGEACSAPGRFHLTCSFRRSSPLRVKPLSFLSSLLLEESRVNEGETLVKTSCLLIRVPMARSVYWAEADRNP